SHPEEREAGVDMRLRHRRVEREHAMERGERMLVLLRVQHDDALREALADLRVRPHARLRSRQNENQSSDKSDCRDGGEQRSRTQILSHTAPLCGAVDTNGTPKKVRKASANTPRIISADARGERRKAT